MKLINALLVSLLFRREIVASSAKEPSGSEKPVAVGAMVVSALFLVGGMANAGELYSSRCAGDMQRLRRMYPNNFWADPAAFFTDGDLVNLGADFCLMPSMFEPGGIVQQEFFVAGTPVIAFKTGGLKDTVREYDPTTRAGTGFTFEAYEHHDYMMACERAMRVFHDGAAYARIRRNARDSVIDLDVVSKAWYREFHRLRRCLPPPPSAPPADTPVPFALGVGEVPGVAPGSTVTVTGSFAGACVGARGRGSGRASDGGVAWCASGVVCE